MILQELIDMTYKQARELGACELFTGKETTIGEMAKLFTSVQGMEFCMRYHFPHLSTLRDFAKVEDLQGYGIFLDREHVTLHNVPLVILVGRTTANIYCDQTKGYNIYLLSGARAVVNCGGWSVVRVQSEKGCSVIKNISDHAIVL